MICRTAVLSFAIVSTALSAQSPSVQRVTPVTGRSTAAAAPVKLTARCISCSSIIEGDVDVSLDGVAFCCTGMKTDSQLVTARCPYSFKLSIASVSQQFVETSDDGTVWHVVTTSKTHYAFASSDDAELSAAFEMLRKASKRIVSEKDSEKYASILTSTRPPKLLPGQCGR